MKCNCRAICDIFVDLDFISDNSMLFYCDFNKWNLTKDPIIENIERCLKNGVKMSFDGVLEEMELIENYGHSVGNALLKCSLAESFQNYFYICWQTDIKRVVDRIGKTKFRIKSDEKKHIHTPHFHVEDTNYGDYSYDFSGIQLAGEKIGPTISKRIKCFLNKNSSKNKLFDEWNRCNPELALTIT